VLFASKNNKAVDVVVDRVNGLGNRPVLIRLGAQEHQQNLAAYLPTLPSASSEPSEPARYQAVERRQADLRREMDAVDTAFQQLIELRTGLTAWNRPLRGQGKHLAKIGSPACEYLRPGNGTQPPFGSKRLRRRLIARSRQASFVCSGPGCTTAGSLALHRRPPP
jgi:hypothetical protein